MAPAFFSFAYVERVLVPLKNPRDIQACLVLCLLPGLHPEILWSPLARQFSTGLSGMALMKSSEQLEPLSLSMCLDALFHRQKHHGDPVREGSLR